MKPIQTSAMKNVVISATSTTTNVTMATLKMTMAEMMDVMKKWDGSASSEAPSKLQNVMKSEVTIETVAFTHVMTVMS